MNANCKTWIIPRAEETPDWNAVPELEVSEVLWLPDCGIRAFGRFCYNAESLHVRLRAVEENIRAEYTAPLSRVCEDSCLEFFFMPEKDDRYFNFEINPNGCPYVGFGRSRQDRVVLYRRDAKQLFAIRTQKTPDGWEAAYRLPFPSCVSSGRISLSPVPFAPMCTSAAKKPPASIIFPGIPVPPKPRIFTGPRISAS